MTAWMSNSAVRYFCVIENWEIDLVAFSSITFLYVWCVVWDSRWFTNKHTIVAYDVELWERRVGISMKMFDSTIVKQPIWRTKKLQCERVNEHNLQRTQCLFINTHAFSIWLTMKSLFITHSLQYVCTTTYHFTRDITCGFFVGVVCLPYPLMFLLFLQGFGIIFLCLSVLSVGQFVWKFNRKLEPLFHIRCSIRIRYAHPLDIAPLDSLNVDHLVTLTVTPDHPAGDGGMLFTNTCFVCYFGMRRASSLFSLLILVKLYAKTNGAYRKCGLITNTHISNIFQWQWNTCNGTLTEYLFEA